MRVIQDQQGISCFSPAKLNLFLAIHGLRSDRFHELETIMVRLNWHDELQVVLRPDRQLSLAVTTVSSPVPSTPIPTDESNLVIRAAELLRQATGCHEGAGFRLIKRIPAEAGLAGGSGNAAAALLLLNQLWKLNCSRAELQQIAAQLGSDIPFFLDSQSAAVARGRGEILTPFALSRRLHFVVVKPEFGLRTAAVYRTFAMQDLAASNASPSLTPAKNSQRPATNGCETLRLALANGNWSTLTGLLRNDLLPAALVLEPRLKLVLSFLQKYCSGGTLMTGSGSACFGVCPTARTARQAAARLRAMQVGAVRATMSL